MASPYRSRYSGPQDRKISATPGMAVLKIGHEAIHRFGEGVKTLICQVGVTGCRLGTLVSEEFLNHPQIDAPLKQMRRIGMAQGMDRCLLTDLALDQNDLEGLLQGGEIGR